MAIGWRASNTVMWVVIDSNDVSNKHQFLPDLANVTHANTCGIL